MRSGDNSIALHARGRKILFPRRPLLMGILNINDDSFSGDGCLDIKWALTRAMEMISEGADIVDVGGESARTNRGPISENEEWQRISLFIEKFGEIIKGAQPRDKEQLFPPLLSVNTWRPVVAQRALHGGCDILNDIGGLPDARNASLCAETGAALLIMHSRGEPKTAHTHVTYQNIMTELESFFSQKIEFAIQAGINREQIIIDPGIDFAKQAEDNLRIYRELPELAKFKRPLLLPVSRKSVIGESLGIDIPAARDAGTVACIVAGYLRGTSIFRVHNVSAAWQTIRTCEVIE